MAGLGRDSSESRDRSGQEDPPPRTSPRRTSAPHHRACSPPRPSSGPAVTSRCRRPVPPERVRRRRVALNGCLALRSAAQLCSARRCAAESSRCSWPGQRPPRADRAPRSPPRAPTAPRQRWGRCAPQLHSDVLHSNARRAAHDAAERRAAEFSRRSWPGSRPPRAGRAPRSPPRCRHTLQYKRGSRRRCRHGSRPRRAGQAPRSQPRGPPAPR